jgi:mono/diheme cytochrome c family protein
MKSLVLVCALLSTACATGGQPVSYTSPQVQSGEQAYRAACVACHNADLSGAGDAPALAGPSFAPRWDGRPISELTGFMKDHMPQTNPGMLNDSTYVALVAYLLAKNGVPPGEVPLIFGAPGTIVIEPL